MGLLKVNMPWNPSCVKCVWLENYLQTNEVLCADCQQPIVISQRFRRHAYVDCTGTPGIFALCCNPALRAIYQAAIMPPLKGFKVIYIGGQLGLGNQNAKKVICPVCFNLSSLIDKDSDIIQLECCRVRKGVSPKLFAELEKRLVVTAPL